MAAFGLDLDLDFDLDPETPRLPLLLPLDGDRPVPAALVACIVLVSPPTITTKFALMWAGAHHSHVVPGPPLFLS